MTRLDSCAVTLTHHVVTGASVDTTGKNRSEPNRGADPLYLDVPGGRAHIPGSHPPHGRASRRLDAGAAPKTLVRHPTNASFFQGGTGTRSACMAAPVSISRWFGTETFWLTAQKNTVVMTTGSVTLMTVIICYLYIRVSNCALSTYT